MARGSGKRDCTQYKLKRKLRSCRITNNKPFEMQEAPEHGFTVGQRLEAADLMDPRLVCVATVAQIVGRLIKVI